MLGFGCVVVVVAGGAGDWCSVYRVCVEVVCMRFVDGDWDA